MSIQTDSSLAVTIHNYSAKSRNNPNTEKNMVHPYNGVLLGNKKKLNTDQCYSTDEL